MAATRKTKAEDRNAREALAQDTISIPALPLSVAAFCGAKSVIHVSGRFCWVKVNGQWLYETRQIPSALRSAKPIRWRIR